MIDHFDHQTVLVQTLYAAYWDFVLVHQKWAAAVVRFLDPDLVQTAFLLCLILDLVCRIVASEFDLGLNQKAAPCLAKPASGC